MSFYFEFEDGDEEDFISPRYKRGGLKRGSKNSRTIRLQGALSRNRGRGNSSVRVRYGGGNHRQQVVVKWRYHKSYGGENKGLRKHVEYLEKEGKGVDGGTPTFFNEGSLASESVRNTAKEWEKDRRHYRMILNPQEGRKLDLVAYTREVMGKIEEDLGTKLEWFAVDHYDKDQPDVHVVIRGRDKAGRELWIPSDYIKYGARFTAEKVATDELGLRTEDSITFQAQQALRKNHHTILDTWIKQDLKEGIFFASSEGDGEPEPYSHQAIRETLVLERLRHLRTLGLTEELQSGVFRVRDGFDRKLKELGKLEETATFMRREAGSYGGGTNIIFDRRNPQFKSLTGRVLKRDRINDLSNTTYILLTDRGGKTHYIPLPEGAEHEIEKVKQGGVVTVQVSVRELVKKSDRAIEEYLASKNSRFYERSGHQDYLQQTTKWSPRVIEGFVQNVEQRLGTLMKYGLVERDKTSGYRVSKNLISELEALQRKKREHIVEVRPESFHEVTRLSEKSGKTWLDKILVEQGYDYQSDYLGANLFELELRESLRRRIEYLRAKGLELQDEDGVIRADRKLLFQLENKYREEKREAYREKYNGQFSLSNRVTGEIVGTERDHTRAYLVVRSGDKVSLIPYERRMEKLEEGDIVQFERRADLESEGYSFRRISKAKRQGREQEMETE